MVIIQKFRLMWMCALKQLVPTVWQLCQPSCSSSKLELFIDADVTSIFSQPAWSDQRISSKFERNPSWCLQTQEGFAYWQDARSWQSGFGSKDQRTLWSCGLGWRYSIWSQGPYWLCVHADTHCCREWLSWIHLSVPKAPSASTKMMNIPILDVFTQVMSHQTLSLLCSGLTIDILWKVLSSSSLIVMSSWSLPLPSTNLLRSTRSGRD